MHFDQLTESLDLRFTVSLHGDYPASANSSFTGVCSLNLFFCRLRLVAFQNKYQTLTEHIIHVTTAYM